MAAFRSLGAEAAHLKLHRNRNPGEVSKHHHAGRSVASLAWRQRSWSNPDNTQLAGAIRPALPAVTDKPLPLTYAGARLHRPPVHLSPCRHFTPGKPLCATTPK